LRAELGHVGLLLDLFHFGFAGRQFCGGSLFNLRFWLSLFDLLLHGFLSLLDLHCCRGLILKLHLLVFIFFFGRLIDLFILLWLHINVVLKMAFFFLASWQNKFACSMLSPEHPLAAVNGAICPVHISLSLAFVLEILSFIPIAALPDKLAISMFFVFFVSALILITINL